MWRGWAATNEGVGQVEYVVARRSTRQNADSANGAVLRQRYGTDIGCFLERAPAAAGA